MRKYLLIGMIAVLGWLIVIALYDRSKCSVSLKFIGDTISSHSHNRQVATYRLTNTGSVPAVYFCEGYWPLYLGEELVDGTWKRTAGYEGFDETRLMKLEPGQSIDFEVLPRNVSQKGTNWKVGIEFYADGPAWGPHNSFFQSLFVFFLRKWDKHVTWSGEHPKQLTVVALP